MAPRPRPEEVFTDLSGNADPGTTGDEAEALEHALVTEGAANIEIPDVDLEVVDDDELSGPNDDEDEDEDEEEEGDEDEGDGEVVNGADFDPKDVQLLVKDAELLDEREKAAKTAVDQATANIAAAKSAMKTAKEAGDTDADIASTEAFSKATVALERANDALTQVTSAKAGLKTRAQELFAKAPKDAEGKPILDGSVRTRAAGAQKVEKPSKLVPKFVELNPWFNNKKFAKQADKLKAIDRGLAAERPDLDKNTPEYFTELGKRFNREYPGLYKNLDGKPMATGQRRRGNGTPIPGGASGGGGGGAGPVDANQVKLTNSDLGLMRQFGMDPDNKDHRRNFLAEKRAQAQASGGRAA